MFKLDIKVWNLHLINNDNQLYWACPNRRMWNLNQSPVHMSEKLSLEMSNNSQAEPKIKYLPALD